MNYFVQSWTRDVLRRGRIRCLQRGAMSELCVWRLWRWRVASEPVLLTATRRRGRVLLPSGVGTAAHSSRTPDGRKMLFSLQYPCLVHTEPAGWICWRVRSRWCPWLWKELQTCRVWYWITSDLPCCHALSNRRCWLSNDLSPYCWWSTVGLSCTSKYWILTVLWFKCYCYFVETLNSNYSLGLLYSLIVATTVLLLLRICSTITDTIE